MSALLESLIFKYGEPVARKLLGLDKRSENPKYAISLGGMKIDPMRMVGNQLFKSAISSGGKMSMGIPLIAGGLALAYMRNPLREGSMNYNPYLKEQIDYLSGMDGMIGSNQSSGLTQYGPESVLRGQNVASMFGTNDYRDQLGKKQSYFEDRINKGKNYSQTQYEKTLNEIKQYEQNQVNKELAEEKKATNIKAKNTMTSNQSYNGGGGGEGQGNAGNQTNKSFSASVM